MKLVSLKLSGYRQFFEETGLDIPLGLIGICGPNGVGKSKLIESICYALYGPGKVLPKSDRAADLFSKAGRTNLQVELMMEIRGQNYVLTRTVKGKTTLQLRGSVEILAEGPSATTKKITELLRMSASAFCATFVARQNEIVGLQSLNSSQRREIVNRLIGITQVEYAITAAKMQITDHSRHLDILKAKSTISVADAQKNLNELQQQYDEIRTNSDEHQILVSTLRVASEDAERRWFELQHRVKEAGSLQQRIEEVISDEKTASVNLSSIRERLAKIRVAAESLSEIESLIERTRDLPARLEHCERLQMRESLFDQARKLAEDHGGLALSLKKYSDLKLQLQQIEGKIEHIKTQIMEITPQKVRVEADLERAEHEAKAHEQRKETLETLGADGKCDSCGQILGNNYVNILQNCMVDIEAARENQQVALQDLAALQRSTEELYNQQVILQKSRDALIGQIGELESVPGQEEAKRISLAEVNGRLNTQFADTLDEPYDLTEHNFLRQELSQRKEAEAKIGEYRALTLQGEETWREFHQAEEKISELQQRHVKLVEELAHTKPSAEERESIDTERKAVGSQYKAAIDQQRKLDGELATANERIVSATKKLAEIQRQEQEILAGERRAFILEKTEYALQRLLDEIMAQARPRIVELMETWMKSLMGPRFRSIELKDDYQLIADNGSGPHPISHFSGGEQTLLSIMLRVAISIFCRERAGFDTSFLILDEVFGNQDTEHRQQLVEFLNEIKDHYHQILIVNHIDDVTSMLDNIIDVIPTGNNESKAKIR